jgi:hypothetical protein
VCRGNDAATLCCVQTIGLSDAFLNNPALTLHFSLVHDDPVVFVTVDDVFQVWHADLLEEQVCVSAVARRRVMSRVLLTGG